MATLIGIAQTSLTNLTTQKKLISINPDIPSITISTRYTKIVGNILQNTTYDLFLKADKIDFVYWSEPSPPEVTARIMNRSLGIANGYFSQAINIGSLVNQKTYLYNATTDEAEFDGIVGLWQKNNNFDFSVDNDYYNAKQYAEAGENNG